MNTGLRKKITYRLPMVWVFLLLPLTATYASSFFVSTAYLQSDVSIASQQFKPSLVQLSVGWQFTDKFSVLVQQAQSNEASQVATVSAEIGSLSSVFFRYGSTVNNTVSAYVQAGYSDFNLLMTGTSVQTDEQYADKSLGFGFEERLFNKSDLRIYFEYINHYAVGELGVNSYQLGMRYAFE